MFNDLYYEMYMRGGKSAVDISYPIWSLSRDRLLRTVRIKVRAAGSLPSSMYYIDYRKVFK